MIDDKTARDIINDVALGRPAKEGASAEEAAYRAAVERELIAFRRDNPGAWLHAPGELPEPDPVQAELPDSEEPTDPDGLAGLE